MAQKDFYGILGVAPDATVEEIKKSYRKLARQFHPDINPGDQKAEARFKEISEAYSTLGDAEKRRTYDLGRGGASSAGPSRPSSNPTWGNVWDDFAKAAPRGGSSAQRLLHDATLRGQADWVNALLNQGIVPARETFEFVVRQKRTQWAEVFMSRGARVTPELLDIAMRARDIEMLNVLINSSVVPAAKTVDFAAQAGYYDVVRVLLQRGGPVTAEVRGMMNRAVRDNDPKVLNALLKSGLVPGAETVNLAVSAGWSSAVMAFLSSGAKATPQVFDMFDAAVRRKDLNTANDLLKVIVPPQKTVEYAVGMRWTEAVDAFLARGAHATAAMIDTAVRNNDIKTGEVLLKDGVTPQEKTMVFAVQQKWSAWAELLIAHGAAATPEMLDMAVRRDDMKTAQVLIDAGAAPLRETMVCAGERQDWTQLLKKARRKNGPKQGLFKRGYPAP